MCSGVEVNDVSPTDGDPVQSSEDVRVDVEHWCGSRQRRAADAHATSKRCATLAMHRVVMVPQAQCRREKPVMFCRRLLDDDATNLWRGMRVGEQRLRPSHPEGGPRHDENWAGQARIARPVHAVGAHSPLSRLSVRFRGRSRLSSHARCVG